MLTNDNLYKLPTLSLRFFMVYGPRNPSQGAYAIVTGKFIDRLRQGEPLIIEGDGQNFRDFVHVELRWKIIATFEVTLREMPPKASRMHENSGHRACTSRTTWPGP